MQIQIIGMKISSSLWNISLLFLGISLQGHHQWTLSPGMHNFV